MKKVFVQGTGITQFGELWEQDLRTLALVAIWDAIRDAKVKLEEIDAIYVANMGAGSLAGQDHLGALIAGELGLDVPAIRLEAACASGSVAINSAHLAVQSGKYKKVLVVGVEKMTDVSSGDVTKVLAGASDEEWEEYFGTTFPSLYAMIAREYMRKYSLSRDQLSLVSVKNHEHGLLNPKAQFKKAITIEQVNQAPIVSDPLTLLDCSPISDGAAAIILSSEQAEVELVASEIATSSISLHSRASLTSLDASVKAAKRAYESAGIDSKEIDIAEVHDCFSIAELVAYEDLGFAKPGQAIELIETGKVKRDGSLPINTSGGLKACGHPVGATGIKQAIEITSQLSGKAEDRQVEKNLRYGLTHNVGGSGGTAVINIFRNSE